VGVRHRDEWVASVRCDRDLPKGRPEHHYRVRPPPIIDDAKVSSPLSRADSQPRASGKERPNFIGWHGTGEQEALR
jgi:hypothetical protein